MKQLIYLFIFISFDTLCQAPDVPIGYGVEYGEGGVNLPYYSNDTNLIVSGSGYSGMGLCTKTNGVTEKIITLTDLLQYQTFCYNDSTIHEGQINCPEGRPGCLVFHYGKWTTHIEPTIIGFIEFIKNKKK